MTTALRLRAFLAGAAFATALAFAAPTSSHAADDGPMVYFDMGSVHVQYSHAACGYQTLGINYQLELAEASIESTVEAYDPKIRSEIFYALDDHLAEGGSTGLNALKKVMIKAIQDVIGEDAVTDVLIVQSYVTS